MKQIPEINKIAFIGNYLPRKAARWHQSKSKYHIVQARLQELIEIERRVLLPCGLGLLHVAGELSLRHAV